MSPRDPQAGLEIAQQVRLERSRLHHEVRALKEQAASRARVAQLVIECPPAVKNMRALDLLRWAWGMHMADAQQLLAHPAVGATLFVTAGHLTVRQRLELMKLLCADPEWP